MRERAPWYRRRLGRLGRLPVVLVGGVCRPREAKNLEQDEDSFVPEQLNELGQEGWEAVGLSLKYGDLMAWPVVLLKRPVR